ncbi:MAG: hypothetical protein LC749_18020 [Actinobacteria bacterium]|nr:hypothetical protein [Actinomycetota bacterium]
MELPPVPLSAGGLDEAETWYPLAVAVGEVVSRLWEGKVCYYRSFLWSVTLLARRHRAPHFRMFDELLPAATATHQSQADRCHLSGCAVHRS